MDMDCVTTADKPEWLNWPNKPENAAVYFFAQDFLAELALGFGAQFFKEPLRLRFVFVNYPGVIAQAVTPLVGNEYRIEFSQELPIRLFTRAWELADLLTGANRSHTSSQELIIAFPDLFPGGALTIPYGLSPDRLILEVFQSALTWLFCHEVSHLFQRHAAVRPKRPARDQSKHGDASAVEDAYVVVDSATSAEGRARVVGLDALIYHATELAADLEGLSLAMFFRDPTSGRPSKEFLAPDRIFCLVAGAALACSHFYDLSPANDLSGEPSGEHPDPTIRLMALTRNVEELLLKTTVQAAAPWALDQVAVERLLTLAECAVSVAQGIRTDSVSLAPVFGRMLSEQEHIKRYFDVLSPVWDSLRATIHAQYFGPDAAGIMRLATRT